MPKYAVAGIRLMMEQVCMLIDGKIDAGKIIIRKATNGTMA
jgi:hypothetical protein